MRDSEPERSWLMKTDVHDMVFAVFLGSFVCIPFDDILFISFAFSRQLAGDFLHHGLLVTNFSEAKCQRHEVETIQRTHSTTPQKQEPKEGDSQG